MKQIMTVAAFTFKEGARRKAFIITNVILVLVILVACVLLPRIGGGSTGSPGDSEFAFGTYCFLLDESDGAIPGAYEALEAMGMNVTALESEAQLENALENVQKNDSGILRILPPADAAGAPRVQVYAKSQMSGFPSVASAAVRQLNALYRQTILAGYGVSVEDLQLVLPDLAVDTEFVANDLSNMVTGGALMFLMFFAIYYYGASVAMSVATEKSSRVMETLIVSAKPGRILLGKCLGAGALGFLQFTGLLALSAGGAKFLMPAGSAMPFQLPDLSLGKALLILLYFILGYALFAMLNSVCGAMVSKMEDINSAMMPINLITVASFYGGYFTNLLGSGSGSRIMLLIPFTSPFAVPYQLLSGMPEPGQLAASLALLLAAIALLSRVSMRVYAASVLHYGQKLRWKDLAGMMKRS